MLWLTNAYLIGHMPLEESPWRRNPWMNGMVCCSSSSFPEAPAKQFYMLVQHYRATLLGPTFLVNDWCMMMDTVERRLNFHQTSLSTLFIIFSFLRWRQPRRCRLATSFHNVDQYRLDNAGWCWTRLATWNFTDAQGCPIAFLQIV